MAARGVRAIDVRAPGRDATTTVPLLLRVTIFAALVLPANMVFEAIGASGYLAMLIGLALFAVWVAAVTWGVHDPTRVRHPARIGLCLFWVATVVSYLRMGGVEPIQRAAADRWLLALFAMSVLVLATAECVRTVEQALVIARTVALGASVTAAVALWQFVVKTDPLDLVRSMMVGMTDNGGGTTFQGRGLLTRVAGNTFTPIELGLVTAMILPFCVWRALFDTTGRHWVHWLQCLLIAFASFLTVSRSAVLGLVVAAVVTVPFLPRHARRWAAIAIPVLIVGVFVTVPGLIATLSATVRADSGNDPSLATRVNNYPRVQAMIVERPWFGTGPATYLPTNALEILDNQYLHTAVEMGLFGLAALVALFLCPIVASLSVALWSRDPALKLLAASAAAACLVAAVGSATFDSLSFPVFRLICPVFFGMSGVVWIMARNAPSRSAAPSHTADSPGPSVRFSERT
ncbi:O-antigen ligase [Rhodococcus sp. SORGH_AS_0303]|uniref:O-antigen ligase family protein n=1 Tax=Rhodococcus sp. SORGH_AS_0303 TaxID=3041753 RepID=UPI0027821F6E|nr:O-antigen ligase family protein [Rhodococcus sp. SORGH_AS_0303]MDQ1199894.1 putative inorganic carbon (HCO3(-)) transporter [Rhodococcus sp. SORGH_AS_0303]